MATEIPRVLEPVPRTTNDPVQDFPIVLDWFVKAYQAINQAILYINSIVTAEALAAEFINGEVLVDEGNTSGSVTFDVAQIDDNYRIIIQPKSITGAPTANSYLIQSKTYNTDGFSFTLVAAPGVGTGIVFEWQLFRNSFTIPDEGE